MNLKYLAVGALLASLLVLGRVSAQVNYSVAGSTYTQNFDSGLPSTAVTLTWANNTTFAGWYVYQAAKDAAPVSYRRTNSANSKGIVLYQWRKPISSSDGALGTRPYNATGDTIMGLHLSNNTGSTLTEFTLGYTGEQWYQSKTASNNSVVVSYRIGNESNLDSEGWTTIPLLEFNSIFEAGIAENLDGSLAVNQEVFAPITVSSISWDDGEDLWIRWFDSNDRNYDQGLGIDDVSFTAISEPSHYTRIPEPSYYTVIFGLSILILTACRRRQSK